jgi:hypothetical protein
MPRSSGKALVLLVALMACDGESLAPVPGSGAVPILPAAGSYEVVVIDSAGATLTGVGLTPAGEVFGTVSPPIGGLPSTIFRWKAGVITPITSPNTPLTITRMNDAGDLIGDLGALRPIVWWAGASSPTRLFPADTAIAAVDINNDGEILLYPKQEYSPGASVWRNGEVRPVVAGTPAEPLFGLDDGVIAVRSRGGLTDSSWFVSSPFHQGSPRNLGATCPGRGGSLVAAADRSGSRALLQRTVGDSSRSFVADDRVCRDASSMVPGFTITGFGGGGWLTARNDDPNQYAIVANGHIALSNGIDAITLRALIEPVIPEGRSMDFIIDVNAAGWILVRATSTGAKRGLLLLKPRQ